VISRNFICSSKFIKCTKKIH